ncbi:hypothetical protein [Longimicrobium terrae]|uniref:Fibrobacter succinogenes major paralogous domain-containing protein n=1 Tax=Longimicrobium terrae TaxID=1639882 RepID=A0A841H016_9BACT|nr:hypothetical protein [Longimicrobium terrae]MBB4637076.1 hypothetical protein [Longimicrobium terrae]MBB6071316.1 hypothetical protein [Longimicrobium terrae]NNC31465.1 hypothetical protein [Longimicrobium terrae]
MKLKLLLIVLLCACTASAHGQRSASFQDAGPAGRTPGREVGETGYVTFRYRGQQVRLATVRAEDGNVWLQQNLGSERVAEDREDSRAYGDLFQWGRWDDGHQVREPANTRALPGALHTGTIDPATHPRDPGQVASAGRVPFMYNFPWWWPSDRPADEWTGRSPADASARRGVDPCAAIGGNWRLPSSADFAAIDRAAVITDANGAWQSTLKLPLAGVRDHNTGELQNGDRAGVFWTSSLDGQGNGVAFDAASGEIGVNERGVGSSVRCVMTGGAPSAGDAAPGAAAFTPAGMQTPDDAMLARKLEALTRKINERLRNPRN